MLTGLLTWTAVGSDVILVVAEPTSSDSPQKHAPNALLRGRLTKHSTVCPATLFQQKGQGNYVVSSHFRLIHSSPWLVIAPLSSLVVDYDLAPTSSIIMQLEDITYT